jgi:hypothetical protein
LRENGKPEINFFGNPCFKLFKDSLDARMKFLTSQGVGANVKQADPFTEEEEETFGGNKVY